MKIQLNFTQINYENGRIRMRDMSYQIRRRGYKDGLL